MLATEMIKQLQKAITEHGDLDVAIDPVRNLTNHFVTSEGIDTMLVTKKNDLMYEIAMDARNPEVIKVLYIW